MIGAIIVLNHAKRIFTQSFMKWNKYHIYCQHMVNPPLVQVRLHSKYLLVVSKLKLMNSWKITCGNSAWNHVFYKAQKMLFTLVNTLLKKWSCSVLCFPCVICYGQINEIANLFLMINLNPVGHPFDSTYISTFWYIFNKGDIQKWSKATWIALN